MDAYPGALYIGAGAVGIVLVKTQFRLQSFHKDGYGAVVGKRCSLELLDYPSYVHFYVNVGVVRGEATTTFEVLNVEC